MFYVSYNQRLQKTIRAARVEKIGQNMLTEKKSLRGEVGFGLCFEVHILV